jgi:hypothetical protein
MLCVWVSLWIKLEYCNYKRNLHKDAIGGKPDDGSVVM